MSKKNRSQGKDNFNQAMFDMFGIGKDAGAEEDMIEEPEALGKAEDVIEQASVKPSHAARSTFADSSRETVHRAKGTYFAEGTSIEGTIHCDSDVELCGDFKGELVAKGKVTIHASTTSNIAASDLVLVDCTLTGDATVTGSVTIDGNSSINGNVTAANVICAGVVRGNLRVSENITLHEKAQVYGDLSTDTLAIARGAKISGKIEMGLKN